MKRCLPCGARWLTWSAFGKHMIHVHGIDRDTFWRRANQIGDAPCFAVRYGRGNWALMVQGTLEL